jgi:AcrR family transcriptional regulator
MSSDAPRPPAATRDVLLAAAAAVFAERGYRAATVRDICRQAGTNVAAVNYHFGDKSVLYLEVLRYAADRAFDRHPIEIAGAPQAPPAERLRAFVHGLLQRLLDPSPGAWHGKLMAREMIEPTAALDTVIAERIRPMADHVRALIRPLLGPGTADPVLRLCGSSIVSQCLFYAHCRPVLTRLFPDQSLEPPALARLADHITRFSVAALQHYRDRQPARAGRRRARHPTPS